MQTKNAKSGGGNKFTAFLKRNIYYILMILCVLAIGSMITVAAVLNNSGGDTDVVVPPNEPDVPTVNPPKPKEFILSMPVNGEIILSFGATYTGKLGATLHEAIDIAGAAGANVIAPFDGKVTNIDKKDAELFGTIVTIDHGNGYISTISLLDSVAVSLNQQITSGTVLGKVASGDKSYFESALNKEHIHYELTKDSKKVDPMQFMADGNK